MVEKAGELLKDNLSGVKQREQEKLKDEISKTYPAKMGLGWQCEEGCRKVCWVMAEPWLGAAGDATAQGERGFAGRCKCLNMDQLRTKERCDSKPVALEEVVVLHSVNLREGTDQRGGDPRIRSIE